MDKDKLRELAELEWNHSISVGGHLNPVFFLYLDDIRDPPNGWAVIRNANEMMDAMNLIRPGGRVQLSLDHDLGDNLPTGYDFITWLESMVYRDPKRWNIETIYIHSANPVGAQRMAQARDSIMRKLAECQEGSDGSS